MCVLMLLIFLVFVTFLNIFMTDVLFICVYMYIILRCLKFLVNSHGAVFGLEISKGMKTGTLCVYVSISDLGIQSVPFGILGRD